MGFCLCTSRFYLLMLVIALGLYALFTDVSPVTPGLLRNTELNNKDIKVRGGGPLGPGTVYANRRKYSSRFQTTGRYTMFSPVPVHGPTPPRHRVEPRRAGLVWLSGWLSLALTPTPSPAPRPGADELVDDEPPDHLPHLRRLPPAGPGTRRDQGRRVDWD